MQHAHVATKKTSCWRSVNCSNAPEEHCLKHAARAKILGRIRRNFSLLVTRYGLAGDVGFQRPDQGSVTSVGLGQPCPQRTTIGPFQTSISENEAHEGQCTGNLPRYETQDLIRMDKDGKTTSWKDLGWHDHIGAQGSSSLAGTR